MSNLAYRQSKIQEKRKQTPWRDFVMEICSWFGVMLYKTQWRVNCFPDTPRIQLVSLDIFEAERGSVYDISWNTFFDTLQSLFRQHPFPHIHHIGDNENSLYSSMIYGAKNSYLSTEVIFSSNVCYSIWIKDNSDMVIDSANVVGNNSNIYMSNTVRNSFNVFYSQWIVSSNDIWFSYNLQWCSHCIACHWLENAHYYIHNKAHTKEWFEEYIQKFLAQKSKFPDWFVNHAWKVCINSDPLWGIGIIDSKNIDNAYFTSRLEYGRNIFFVWGWDKNQYIYDTAIAGVPYGSHMYGVVGASWEQYYCSMEITTSQNIYYSFFLEGCSFCLGCIWLKNKQFCILNKQYTKDERYEKVDEIFAQMEKDGTLGEFFPASMNPFYFNDTAAYLIDNSFTKEEVTAKWYLRRDEPIKVDIPEWAKVVKTSELDQYEWRKVGEEGVIARRRHDDVAIHWTTKNDEWDPSTSVGMTQSWYIDPEILKVIIQDEAWNVYRIVKMEYDFLMKHWLPLPRKHRLDRMKENFKIAN